MKNSTTQKLCQHAFGKPIKNSGLPFNTDQFTSLAFIMYKIYKLCKSEIGKFETKMSRHQFRTSRGLLYIKFKIFCTNAYFDFGRYYCIKRFKSVIHLNVFDILCKIHF